MKYKLMTGEIAETWFDWRDQVQQFREFGWHMTSRTKLSSGYLTVYRKEV